MAYELNADHIARAFAGGSLPDGDGPVAMKVIEAGDLIVTSQLVAASDPVVEFLPDPFTQTVPNGRHRVTLAIADYGTDEHVAFARVQFSNQSAVLWKMAVTTPTADLSTLGPNEHFGYPVDSGTGCFMDPAAGKLLAARCSRDDDFLDDAMSQRLDRGWANVRPDTDREENVICFRSGFGDGNYPSFFGFDATGQACQLITDFGLFYEEPAEASAGRRWWQFWK